MKYFPLLIIWLVIWPFGAGAQGEVRAWQLDPAMSSIRFSVAIENSPAEGEFTSFSTLILFDPENLPESRVEVSIDLDHIEASYDDVARNLKKANWFDVAHYPTAHFVGQDFKFLGDKNYQVNGELTLRDVTRPETLYFTLTEYDDRHARIKGRMILDRRDYGVGQGGWRDVSPVAGKVFLTVIIAATKQQFP